MPGKPEKAPNISSISFHIADGSPRTASVGEWVNVKGKNPRGFQYDVLGKITNIFTSKGHRVLTIEDLDGEETLACDEDITLFEKRDALK